MTDPRHILDGYRVLDFTQVVAGPTVTRLMAEMGAEVIKVELAPGGDLARLLPFIRDGRSGYFVQQNRGKQSLCVDARSAEGRQILRDLAGTVDVLVESFAPGAIGRLGLDWDTVHGLNPRLVMCSISAFGQTGPMAGLPGYDYIAQAYAGFTDLIGEEGGSPYFPQLAFGDAATGGFALAAVLAALLHRERGGPGQYLDVSLLDVYLNGQEIAVQAASLSDGAVVPRRTGRQHFSVCPLGIFRGAQGYLVIVGLGKQWDQLCRVLGRPELAGDPRFATNAARVDHVDEVAALIEAWLARVGDDAEAIRLLEAERVPVAPVLSVPEVMRLPQVQARGAVRTVVDRALGAFEIPGMPLRFSAFAEPLDLDAPFLGEHNAAVLQRHLGYDAARIAALEAARARGLKSISRPLRKGWRALSQPGASRVMPAAGPRRWWPDRAPAPPARSNGGPPRQGDRRSGCAGSRGSTPASWRPRVRPRDRRPRWTCAPTAGGA
jgi:crotonobetainyl-CoA:carnitine CoA-transferase CaiB-like acyl-CoA transferase